MKLLDRYILRKIALPLILVFVTFVGIFILVDLFDHANRFIDNDVPVQLVGLYYLYYTPMIIVLTAPVAMLLATLLALGRLSRKNEIMAMKGSGVSLYRILAPVLLLALCLSLVTLVVGEELLPPATQRRLDIEEQTIDRKPSRMIRTDLIYMYPDGNVLLARRFNLRSGTMEDVTYEEFGEGHLPTRRIDAPLARWTGDRWVLEGGSVRRFEDGEETIRSFDRVPLPGDEPTPEELAARPVEPEEMGYLDLRDYIARLRAGGNDPRDLEVQLRLKIAFPFVTLIMTLLGAPLAAGTRRSGFAIAFTSALAISFVYYGVIQIGQVLGEETILPPWLAAWMANIIFGILGVYLLVRTPK
ncbi:MAG: LPS export ABC transporter permease LptG [Candidatus Eisenbacteria bacterium]|nr:LPS export ABC transporter permease LptG [Candidatus Eisenbacteria bacterium]